ncbi:hypothetical protein J8L70_06990 [Pseudoalteromonas sp. MMG010]|uniref:DUF6765 family protein n=1 Tax=Pseudoalteromonas sp. MMG010 TaxID=2822685 RepID=UPI001B39E070|nr:DUF6765 family protein [Pseudoalteromonas sp. MMG010]MBQ4832980.1 hypothetical protein [Pseudoalteromonas sp. MMG010]
MQIDLHHGMTWVIARAAGFSVEEATIIAHASQYVDDATNYGHIEFSNGAAYERIATAHKMLDYKNLDSLKNMKVWVPFHFLPGNGGLPAGQNPSGTFIKKLVCKPGSYIAKDMISECIAEKNRPYGLHRLGITSHVFIDTWGHQGFAGVNHDVNKVENILDRNGHPELELTERISGFFSSIFQDDIPSLGHGQALSNPDLPHQEWSYTNGLGEEVVRNNTADFLIATNELCKTYQRYLDIEENGLPDELKFEISMCFTEFDMNDGEARHKLWLEAIENDRFNLGAYTLDYIAKGEGSWKHQALGTTLSDGDEDKYEFTADFMTSNWKYFHDAAKKHKLTIIDDILPQYGICVG